MAKLFTRSNLILTIVCIGMVAGLYMVQTAMNKTLEENRKERVLKPKKVLTTKVELGAAQRSFRFSAVSRAAQRAKLSFLVSGSLSTRPVDLGSHVKQGNVVATLHNPQLVPNATAAQAQVKEIETRLTQAERDLRRVSRLRRDDAATSEEYDAVQAKRNTLRASLETAKAKQQETANLLQEAKLTAPFDGVVEQVLLEEGEFVAPGVPVMVISRQTNHEAEFDIPEGLVGDLTIGTKVTLTLPYLDKATVTGEIYRIGEAGLGQGRLFPVMVRFVNTTNLPSGLTVEWHLKKDLGQQLLIPINAIVNPGSEKHRVYKVVDGKVETVLVKPGRLVSGKISVTGDLAAGDTIISSGHASLRNGQQVTEGK